MPSLTYRPEIDGLRAVSVLGVVLFHARFGASGGYVGVDVFFVISGYLITSLILKDLSAGTFSLAHFWERRVRRILPALTVVLAVTLAVGTALLLPRDLKSLSASSLAVLGLISNLYFWRDTGYFAGAAEMKPLLHTWSLAVEEQFYLLYPPVVLLLYRIGRQWLPVILATAGAVSLALSIYGTWHHPAAAFYLLPTRAWELLAGGVLACLPVQEATTRSWRREFVSACGLLAIVASMVIYDDSTFFPGLAAVLPVAGTVGFIWANTSRRTTSGNWLATRPLVVIGLASYSWYLWHWPALVLLHYVGGANFERPELRLAAVAASLLLALLSWRVVEQGFRRRHWAPTRFRLATVFVSSGAALAAVAGWTYWQQGLPDRFPTRVLRLAEEQSNASYPSPTDEDIRADRVPMLGREDVRPTCLLWGDSHAIVVRKLIDDLSREYGVATYSVAREASPIVTSDSADRNREVLDFIARHQIRTVLLVARWSSVYDDVLQMRPHLVSAQERQHRRSSLRALLEELNDRNCRVWIMLEVPCQPGGDAYQAQVVLSQVWPDWCRLERTTRAGHEAATAISRSVIRDAASGLAHVIDPGDTCFDDQGLSIVFQDGQVCYLDDDHLTDAGANMLLAPLLRPALAHAAAAAPAADPQDGGAKEGERRGDEPGR